MTGIIMLMGSNEFLPFIEHRLVRSYDITV